MSKLISIIVPVYNEKENILSIYDELVKALREIEEKYDYEIIFVNDGSIDGSGGIIDRLTEENEKIKHLEFSRNFNKEVATSAGLHYSSGNAVIVIDADLQHPPSLIPEFVRKWEGGNDMVVGLRKTNKGEGMIKKTGSFFFYKIMNVIGQTKIMPYSTDFRLVDRKVVDEFNRLTEKNRITRGLMDWLGFKKEYVCFDAGERKSGKSTYGNFKLVKLAFSSFITHSLFPLKLAGYLGIVITFFSGLLASFMIVEKFVFNDILKMNFSPLAFLAVMILFLIGIVLVCLGLITLYIANIHGEVLNRPMYIIKKKKNLE